MCWINMQVTRISLMLFDALACTCFLHSHNATLVSNYWRNLCGHYSVLKVIVIVPCWLYWVVGWVGHGSNFSFVMGWAGLGWVSTELKKTKAAMKKTKNKNQDAEKKRSSHKVRGVSPEAGRESIYGGKN